MIFLFFLFDWACWACLFLELCGKVKDWWPFSFNFSGNFEIILDKALFLTSFVGMKKKIHIRRKAQMKGHKAAVFSLSEGRSPGRILSGAGEGWIVEWDLAAPDLGKVIAQVEGNIFSLHYLAEREQVVAGTMYGGVHWVDLQDPERTLNVAHHKKGVYAMLPLGASLFTGGGDGVLTRWSIAERRTQESLQLSHQSIRSIAYSPERNELAVGASDHHIYLLDASSLTLKQQLENAHDNSVFSVHYSPGGQYLLSGGRDAHLRIWDLEQEASPIHHIPAHLFTINHILWPPQQDFFFTASRDKTIKVWDGATFELLKVVEGLRDQGHFNSVNRLHWQAGQLISASDDRSLILWELGQ